MKNIVLLILFLVTLFITNIFFYYNSEYYQNFIKGIKDGDDFVSRNIGDDINSTDIEKRIGSIKQELLNKKEQESFELITQNDNNSTYEEVPEIKELPPQNTITLGRKYLEIVQLFSQYSMKKLDVTTKLFDITNEYPDPYFEYYSRDVSLYIFPTKSYDEVLDVFLVLEDELPFTINITNNLGNNTFYINLNENIADGVVRMVVQSQNKVFGLKIKNNQYNTVKSILQKLPTN